MGVSRGVPGTPHVVEIWEVWSGAGRGSVFEIVFFEELAEVVAGEAARFGGLGDVVVVLFVGTLEVSTLKLVDDGLFGVFEGGV